MKPKDFSKFAISASCLETCEINSALVVSLCYDKRSRRKSSKRAGPRVQRSTEKRCGVTERSFYL